MEQLPPSVVDKLKRVGVTLIVVALIALNKKLGLGLGTEEIAGIATVVLGYVVSGTWKAALNEKAVAAGKKAADEVKTPEDVVAALKDATK